jgi:5-methylthioribose kinase
MYRILDRHTVCDYIRSIPAAAQALGHADKLEVEEIGNGNLNFVYRIRSGEDPSRSVIVKQAVPYLRMVGESWPLDRERMTYEIRALTLYNELVPSFVPRIYHADEQMSVLVMQCLDDHIILRQGMIAGTRYPKVAEHIGEFLAQTLFRTSAFSMESQARRRLSDRFTLNSELCKLTEEFIFTFPYMEHASNYVNPPTNAWAREHIHANSAFKAGVLKFKELFVTKQDALLHADLHTGSLMVNADETYVIDMEFAYFGPFGFDVGKIIANFLMCATSQLHRSTDRAYLDWLLEQAQVIWTVFAESFQRLWSDTRESAMIIDGLLSPAERAAYQQRTMQRIFQDTIGFCACSMARRTLGIAGVADIRDIADTAVRSKLEIINLQLATQLMTQHDQLQTIDDFARLVRDFYRAQPQLS